MSIHRRLPLKARAKAPEEIMTVHVPDEEFGSRMYTKPKKG